MTAVKPVITVTGSEWLPFSDWKILDNGEKTLTGPLRILLETLSQHVKFEYELITPPDMLWGVMLPNGSWNGMLGQIQKEVWLLILASLLSVGTAMACVVWAEGKIFRVITRNIVSKASTWVLLTLSQEGSEWLPKEDGGRVIVTTWLLASLVFMTSYSGILTAMLTLPRVVITIDSLPDLVSQSALPWYIEEGASLLNFLQGSKNELHQIAYKERYQGNFSNRLQVLKQIIDRKLTAFVAGTTVLKAMDLDFSASGECHLYITQGDVMTNIEMSLAFRKNSKYLAKANHVIRIVLESGLWNKWLADELTNSTHCLHHPKKDRMGDGIQPLDIESFTGPLFVILGGLSLACVVFLCEFLHSPRATA
ncbi:glutamate receptor ionotropic, kainate 2-like isoform X2 [Panulirus ornatus]|uniref:glutamate receptor ionotropic, kainate 2-like isoform X2 n=1 Tax=Panulirus ornatus TaxID=150431 RepID=UPI003A849B1E